ncbi:uncharacterized protein SCHCODRAFT_02610069 [Schizophyllum commune H4-8]|uniref:uncharacterized protein n=1 Tax=Schizophyllum commune (strain H4-8 / FGSC 9210) TaxID=578458 RepID=UPI00215FC8E6|nr:uncharacterized protein SCHCODRAFT_02610069 [Schizophyllum commune H4-8]KAI5897727.1 hypothetical protein SCHCODRAFT_02610069 [Schizophyllum commune H4-8]
MAEPTLPLDILTRIADDLLAFRTERNSDIIKYGDMNKDIKQSQAAAAALATSGSRVLRDRINPMLYQSPRFWTTYEMYLFRRTLGREQAYRYPRNTEAHGLAFMVRRLVLGTWGSEERRSDLRLSSLESDEIYHHFRQCILLCPRVTSLIVPFSASRGETYNKITYRGSLAELSLCGVNNMDSSAFLTLDSLETYMTGRIKDLSMENFSYSPVEESMPRLAPVDISLESLSLYRGNLAKTSFEGLLASSRDSLTRLSVDFAGEYPGNHITVHDFKTSILSVVHLQHLTVFTKGYRPSGFGGSRSFRLTGLIDEVAPYLWQLQSLEFDEDLGTTALFDNMPATLKVLRLVHPACIHPSDLPLLAAQAVRRLQLALRRVVVIWKDGDHDNWRRVGGVTTDLLAVQGITLRSFTDCSEKSKEPKAKRLEGKYVYIPPRRAAA